MSRKLLTSFFVSVLSVFLLTGCHDAIFEEIEKEVSVDESRIYGSCSAFIEFNNMVYIATAANKELYRHAKSNTGKGHWQSISTPEIPVFLSNHGGYLYLLTVTYSEGSGDYEGYNIPEYHEFRSSTGESNSWGSKLATYTYDENGNNIPSYYKYQNSSVTASDGNTYTIGTTSNADHVYKNGTHVATNDNCEMWCIAATSNYLLLGGIPDVYKLPLSNCNIGSVTTFDTTIEGETNIFESLRIWAIYVVDPTVPYLQSPIFLFGAPTGGTNADKAGLYAYYPGSGWNSDK